MELRGEHTKGPDLSPARLGLQYSRRWPRPLGFEAHFLTMLRMGVWPRIHWEAADTLCILQPLCPTFILFPVPCALSLPWANP